MQPSTLTEAVQKALKYLSKNQEADGSFKTYLSLDQNIPEIDRPVKTVFMPALILASLSYNNDPVCLAIRQNLATFLLSQKNNQWTFNFWAHDEPIKKTRDYPDDLDDTFCTYIALHAHDSSLITTGLLVDMTKVLLTTEKTVGGPYTTWLVPPTSEKIWLDVDIAVNSNVAYFLSLVSQLPPGLKQYLTQAIETNRLSSPYYAPVYPILYYLARIPAEKTVNRKILHRLMSSIDRNSGLLPLEHALAASSFIRLGAPKTRYSSHIKALLASQLPDGSWPAGGFCTDEYTGNGVLYNGGTSLSTAFAIESLSLFLQETTTQQPLLDITRHVVSPVIHAVSRSTMQACKKLEQPLQDTLLHALSRLEKSSNGKEITLFADSFNNSLHTPLVNHETFLGDLGMANLYGWTAYTIYDDFIDDEGKPLLLSCANAALRVSYETFLGITNSKPFKNFIRYTFNAIDNANTWEIVHSRLNTYKNRTISLETLPDYSDLSSLANRSAGHMLSPLSVLVKGGIEIHSQDFQAVHNALTHYIIAKQLNDDAHDWQEDFLRGHCTYVVATILAELAVVPGVYKFHELLPIMQKHFWHYSLVTVCQQMKHQLTLSRRSLATTSVLKPDNAIATLLEAIEVSIQDTLSKQAQTKEFLKYF